ncbi:MAG: hypothetical protein M0T83_02035 [Nitrospiraceae bacterium]|nr:hypothetical protein [Nitrospiraceae bacterium]
MLILIRQNPDDRLRELLDSIDQETSATTLVYLDRAQATGTASPLPVLADRTFSLHAPPAAGVIPIDGQALLELIHTHDRILVLP